MPPAKPKSLEELETQKQPSKTRLLQPSDKQQLNENLPSKPVSADYGIRGFKSGSGENHAKILIGVAMIHQCQASEPSATKFKAC